MELFAVFVSDIMLIELVCVVTGELRGAPCMLSCTAGVVTHPSLVTIKLRNYFFGMNDSLLINSLVCMNISCPEHRAEAINLIIILRNTVFIRIEYIPLLLVEASNLSTFNLRNDTGRDTILLCSSYSK